MNKKFSTLLAAFLAAGYCMTAEAGVVKIAKADLKENHQYVIASKAWATGATSNGLWLQSAGAKVQSPAQSGLDAASFTPATDLWKLLISNGKYVFTQGDLAVGTAEGADSPTMRSLTAAEEFELTSADYLQKANGKVLAMATAAEATYAPGSSAAAVDFYAYTTPLATATTGKVLKIGNQYLVVDKTATGVELVSETMYQSYLNLGFVENTLWTIDANGVASSTVTSLASGAKCLKVDGSTGVGFSLITLEHGMQQPEHIASLCLMVVNINCHQPYLQVRLVLKS